MCIYSVLCIPYQQSVSNAIGIRSILIVVLIVILIVILIVKLIAMLIGMLLIVVILL